MINDPYHIVFNPSNISPVIIAIAKKEQPYIEEWVRWHIAFGFDHIFLYDNEDEPTYEFLLKKYSKYITFIHLPGNNFYKGVQYICLDDFIVNHMRINNGYSIHLDIDEFILLKQHNNIKDFIKQFFIDDCGAIGINWRFFGDSNNNLSALDQPITKRFTKRQKGCNQHIKTLFNNYLFKSFNEVHSISLKYNYKTKDTDNHIINGPFNNYCPVDYIQINHYKSKTYEEFLLRYSRGRADIPLYNQHNILDKNIKHIFEVYNLNDEEDLTAYNYSNLVNNFWSEQND